MKKSVFIISATLLLSVVTIHAQQTSFGLKGGLNLSSIEVKNDVDYDTKAGIHFGGLAHIHITPHFALQPELVYSMQGGKDGDFKFKLNYFNVPLLGQYMTNDGFRLQTGPQLGILAKGKTKSGNVEVNVTDALSTVDFSWVFGAGYLFHEGVGIDIRYNLGLSNIIDNSNVVEKNRVFQAGLFYQFSHGAVKKRR